MKFVKLAYAAVIVLCLAGSITASLLFPCKTHHANPLDGDPPSPTPAPPAPSTPAPGNDKKLVAPTTT